MLSGVVIKTKITVGGTSAGVSMTGGDGGNEQDNQCLSTR